MSLHFPSAMGHHKLFYQDARTIRLALNDCIALANEIHRQERALIRLLFNIDLRRYYVRYGYKSLSGFCRRDLGFTKTQAQILVTQVRRYDPMANIVDEEAPPKEPPSKPF